MKIRTKLALLFTFITAIILLLFAAIIYYSAKANREKEFYAALKKEAVTKANLFFNAHVDKKILQDIYHNNRKILNEVEVAIYDTTFHLLYHDAVDIDFVKETKHMIHQVYQQGEIAFYQKDWQVVGLQYQFNHKSYVIIAAAYDQYGYAKLNSLLNDSILVFIISMLFLFITGIFFSQKVLAPVSRITERAKNISATNLDLRLTYDGSKDELSALTNTFNEMLDRLENSFDAQKHFVSNISHELRTPLSAIITELELSETKDRSITEYKTAIANALTDAKRLVRLLGSLLDMAKASYDPTEITFKPIRIDEVLLDARQQAKRINSLYKIDIHFEADIEHDQQVLVYGNEYLLRVAFVNLFENGCKFSADMQSTAYVSFNQDKIQLRFSDKGIGISQTDLQDIFTPFYRGANKEFADGHGIGLSLTKKIVTLHQGTLVIYSKQHKGTSITVELPQSPNPF